MENKKQLIDASAWELFLKERQEYLDGKVYDPYYDGYEDAIGNVDDWMDVQPKVEAVEVVHAKWEDEHGGKFANPRYRCSVCKERALYKFERDLLDNWKEVQALTDNCPHCGARMDGEK